MKLNKETTGIARILQNIKTQSYTGKKKMHKLLSVIWMVSFNGLPIVSKVAALSYNMAEVRFDLTCTERDIPF